MSGSTKYPPRCSPMLVKWTVRGMRLTVTGFTGPYAATGHRIADRSHRAHLCRLGKRPQLFDGEVRARVSSHGSATPSFTRTRRGGMSSSATPCTDLERKHPERLRVIHTLTREPDVALCGPLVRKGRVSAALIRELIPDLDTSIIYVCGPGISKWDRDVAKARARADAPFSRIGPGGSEVARRAERTHQARIVRWALAEGGCGDAKPLRDPRRVVRDVVRRALRRRPPNSVCSPRTASRPPSRS